MQWTGKDYKAMEQTFVGSIAGAASEGVVCAAQSLSDFIFYAHFEAHTDKSLEALDATWSQFHSSKHVFKTEGPK